MRFQRTLDEAHPTIVDIDSYALAAERGYATADARQALDEFCAARAKTVGLLATLSPTDLARTAQFGDYGLVTVRGLVHYLCSHDQQHLAGLPWLLGQIDATPLYARG